MNEQRRKALAARTLAEKARLASGLTADEVAKPPQSNLIFSKHFMIETQYDDEGVPEYAVYRVTDMLSTLTAEGATVEPVHVFEMAFDAATWVVAADVIMEKEDPDSTPVPERLRAMGVLQDGVELPVGEGAGVVTQ